MREEKRTHRAAAALAEGQHGVVSGRQLASLDYSVDKISRESLNGRLHRLHRDVYAVGHAAISHQGRCLAAVLAGGDGALLSHRSAAWLWGLTTRWEPRVEITAASRRRTRSTIRIHSARTLTDADLDSVECIPVTAVPRTLLGFAAIDPRFLDRALGNAERLGLIDIGAIDALLSRSTGLRRLRLALALHRDPAMTKSNLERRFLRLVVDNGLLRPMTNCFIAGYELDAFWPAQRFAVELDTYDYHGDRASFEEDRLRQEELKLAGVEMIRVTGIRLDREPHAVIGRLRTLLAQRERDLNQPRRSPVTSHFIAPSTRKDEVGSWLED